MVSKHFTVSNAQGFHMRPATTFANTMAKYGCKVTIKHNGADVDGKSLMHIMAACIKVGNEIDVICDGDGEDEALAEAAAMIESGFGE
jgi:phosphocarrier protein